MIKKLLVVDDSASWRMFHTSALMKIFEGNCELVTASSAQEGLKLIHDNKSKPFDIILSDLQMELDFEPDSAGEWFVKQIKTLKEYNNAHIIIISAMYNIEKIASDLNVDYIRKSVISRDILPLKLKLDSLNK